MEKRLRHMATHDPLTGLANRDMLRDRIRRELARGRRGDQQFALHYVDLDRFKAINDAHGHHGGDEVLRQVAEALAAIAGDGVMVARIGGDEFVLLQPDITSLDEARCMADAVIAQLNQPDHVAGAFTVGASVGITLSPRDGTDPDELLKNADGDVFGEKERRQRQLLPPRICGRGRARSPNSKRNYAGPSRGRNSCCTTSRRSISNAASCSAPRPCCAGSAPAMGWCVPTSSSVWPRKPG